MMIFYFGLLLCKGGPVPAVNAPSHAMKSVSADRKHEFFGQSLTSFLFSPKEPLIKLHHGTKLCHTSLHLNATFRLESRAFGGLVMKENLGVDKPCVFVGWIFCGCFCCLGGCISICMIKIRPGLTINSH